MQATLTLCNFELDGKDFFGEIGHKIVLTGKEAEWEFTSTGRIGYNNDGSLLILPDEQATQTDAHKSRPV